MPEPVGLAEEVDRPEESLHFKCQFSDDTHRLLPESSGSLRLRKA